MSVLKSSVYGCCDNQKWLALLVKSEVYEKNVQPHCVRCCGVSFLSLLLLIIFFASVGHDNEGICGLFLTSHAYAVCRAV